MCGHVTGPVLPKRRMDDVPNEQLSLADEYAVFELNALPAEVTAYLAAVDEYRAAGYPPVWRDELTEVGA